MVVQLTTVRVRLHRTANRQHSRTTHTNARLAACSSALHGLRLAAHLLRGCSSRPPPAPGHTRAAATCGALSACAPVELKQCCERAGAGCCSTAMTRPRCVLVTASATQQTAAPTHRPHCRHCSLHPSSMRRPSKTCASTAGLKHPHRITHTHQFICQQVVRHHPDLDTGWQRLQEHRRVAVSTQRNTHATAVSQHTR